MLVRVNADVIVGFGGYVALPAYLAARRARLPIVVHEANARPGVANRLAARLTHHVYTASEQVRLPHAVPIGIPLRPAISGLDRTAMRPRARSAFGLLPDAPTLLVTGGSQGAQSLNRACAGAADDLRQAGVQVLHIVGGKNTVAVPPGQPPYAVVPFVEQMHLAYAAADFVLCRCGAMTCAEGFRGRATCGLRALSAWQWRAAIQRRADRRGRRRPARRGRHARPELDRGTCIPIITDPYRLAAMSRSAAGAGVPRRGCRPRSRGAERRGRAPAVRDGPMSGVPERRTASTGPRHDVPTRDADHDRTGRLGGARRGVGAERADRLVPALASLGRVHIMGIAGAGMSALARILIERGVTVTGCEARDSTTVAALRRARCGRPDRSLAPARRHDRHVRVHDSHQPRPIRSSWRPGTSGKPFLRRAAALSSALEDRRMIAIAGTHGKTTTTSLLTVAAQACQLDPSFAIGGNLYETGINAHLGTAGSGDRRGRRK